MSTTTTRNGNEDVENIYTQSEISNAFLSYQYIGNDSDSRSFISSTVSPKDEFATSHESYEAEQLFKLAEKIVNAKEEAEIKQNVLKKHPSWATVNIKGDVKHLYGIAESQGSSFQYTTREQIFQPRQNQAYQYSFENISQTSGSRSNISFLPTATSPLRNPVIMIDKNSSHKVSAFAKEMFGWVLVQVNTAVGEDGVGLRVL